MQKDNNNELQMTLRAKARVPQPVDSKINQISSEFSPNYKGLGNRM